MTEEERNAKRRCEACVWNEARRCGRLFCILARCAKKEVRGFVREKEAGELCSVALTAAGREPES
ncbi:MAG: hypothetical protein Q4B42_04950 [Oscillospiraceae bacterium]|nr:hypothetical protein [Oscillospiraceae bacterium]